MDDYLSFQGNPNLNTQLIQANFGTFGELPVIAVGLTDCYILMDPTNGNLSGPFELGSPLDARGLLSMHAGAFEAGASVQYYDTFGCPTATVASWHPGGPPVTTPLVPRPPTPAALPPCPACLPVTFGPGNCCTPPPGGYVVPCFNPTVAGWTNCVCVSPGPVLCTVVDMVMTGTPPRVYQRIRYYTCPLTVPTTGCAGIVAGCLFVREETWY